jgi:hypothetical protein
MSAVALQIAIMVAVLGPLVWLATRRSRPRGARRPSGDHSWSSDAVYNVGDAGQHHGAGSFDGGSGDSASAGDSGGSSDGGGGGSDGGGGGSSD